MEEAEEMRSRLVKQEEGEWAGMRKAQEEVRERVRNRDLVPPTMMIGRQARSR